MIFLHLLIKRVLYPTVRILRYLAAIGTIAESPEETYSATNITRTLSQQGFGAGLRHQYLRGLNFFLNALTSILVSRPNFLVGSPSLLSWRLPHMPNHQILPTPPSKSRTGPHFLPFNGLLVNLTFCKTSPYGCLHSVRDKDAGSTRFRWNGFQWMNPTERRHCSSTLVVA